ncbi:hypothetical protein GALMADRAFT_142523 [Galerina marginata CBS 339.88]|uniref:Ras-GEF domain-containing protein n=1 Tax=Galerina marginata (strain CBS 339.88) TaxID=685588 RepID=A0A067SYK8_GALM3|nr:hypothetical protein GALMADRAFT_142523 [Galerina marginata CBS 339.88]
MNLPDLIAQPGQRESDDVMSASIKLVELTYNGIQNLEVYKQRCKDMNERLEKVRVYSANSLVGLEEIRFGEITEEIEHIVVRIHHNVQERASWNLIRSFMHQDRHIRGVDRLYRDIETAMIRLKQNMALAFTEPTSKRISNLCRAKAEIRGFLLKVVNSMDEVKTIQNVLSSYDLPAVERMIDGLQKKIIERSLLPSEKELFKAAVKILHQEIKNFNASLGIGVQVSNSITDLSSLKVTAFDTPVIVNVINGKVSTGTLEGLVYHLITNFNSHSTIEYQDVLLSTCADFSTPVDLFAVVSHWFHEAETGKHPKDRVALQYKYIIRNVHVVPLTYLPSSIFMVVKYWLSHRYLQVDQELLGQMKDFCESAVRIMSSTTMMDKARDLLRLIEIRAQKDNLSRAGLAPSRNLLLRSGIKPFDLAVAFTLLEADNYKLLVPADYIVHLGGHYDRSNNVEVALRINDKIMLYVKDDLMRCDSVEHRTDALKLYIDTAQECLKLRNFSSLAAIVTALYSAPIEQLWLINSALPHRLQSKLNTLQDIVDPFSDHRGYRQALNKVGSSERHCCVPWLAVHLKDLNRILQRHPRTEEVDGWLLINFQRYWEFTDCVKEVMGYRPPDLEHCRQQDQLDFVESQLRNLKVLGTSDDHLVVQSRSLDPQETLDHEIRSSRTKTGQRRAEEQNGDQQSEQAVSIVTEYSIASSRTASTDYGLYYTRWALSQESMTPE